MPTPKPPYPSAFRQQMVELVRAGRGISELAREFDRNASSIHAWVKAAGGLDGTGATSVDAPLSIIDRQELIELRRKFKQVHQEPDILAKATAWFAAKSEKTPTSSTNA
jgi:transposase